MIPSVAACRPLRLPNWAAERLDAAARSFLRAGDQPVDFGQPPGEPALMAPDSVSWRVFRAPTALLIGGLTAVLLELAEPTVREAGWERSSFRRAPLRRLQRTGMAALVTVYGPESRSRSMIAAVVALHARIKGSLPDGRPWRADDPRLLDWVQGTAAFGVVEAYQRFVRPLPEEAVDRFYAEGAAAARLYGATNAPDSRKAQREQFGAMLPDLEGSPVVFEFLHVLRRAPLLPTPLRPLQELWIRAAIELLPRDVRHLLGLQAGWNLRPWEVATLQCAGALSDRLLLPCAPAVQACRRLGLPDDHLFR